MKKALNGDQPWIWESDVQETEYRVGQAVIRETSHKSQIKSGRRRPLRASAGLVDEANPMQTACQDYVDLSADSNDSVNHLKISDCHLGALRMLACRTTSSALKTLEFSAEKHAK